MLHPSAYGEPQPDLQADPQLPREVAEAVGPVLKGKRLDMSHASDRELKEMTAFVKSRLMP